MLEVEYSESGLDSHLGGSDPAFTDYFVKAAHGRSPQRAEPPPKKTDTPKPTPKENPAPQDNNQDQPSSGFLQRHPFATVGAVLLALLAAGGSYIWWDNSSHYESTDDAFIASRPTTLSPKVTGYIVSVPVTDNQHVVAGDVIAKLDGRDYRAALDQANAQVAAAQANVANVEAQYDVQQAQIDSAKAQVDQAKATLAFAQQQASRYEQLAKTGSGSVQNAQQFTSQLGQQQAALKSADAAERVAERQLEALKAQTQSAEANLSVSEAQREQARLNLSYTTVKASEPGRVVNLSAARGELAQPGAALAMFVPDETWIVANFKETQLDHMRPGQPVSFSIDAYPEREFHGHVESVQPGSGTAFSLLPAQNATGNYVKVVQRVPVKVVLDNAPPDLALGPGMSVVPTVRVDPQPSIWEHLERWWSGA